MDNAQPKDEHPMQSEWDEIKNRARKQGLLHKDGTLASPPLRGGALRNRPMHRKLDIITFK